MVCCFVLHQRYIINRPFMTVHHISKASDPMGLLSYNSVHCRYLAVYGFLAVLSKYLNLFQHKIFDTTPLHWRIGACKMLILINIGAEQPITFWWLSAALFTFWWLLAALFSDVRTAHKWNKFDTFHTCTHMLSLDINDKMGVNDDCNTIYVV